MLKTFRVRPYDPLFDKARVWGGGHTRETDPVRQAVDDYRPKLEWAIYHAAKALNGEPGW